MSFTQSEMPRCGGVRMVYGCCTHNTPPLHTKPEAL